MVVGSYAATHQLQHYLTVSAEQRSQTASISRPLARAKRCGVSRSAGRDDDQAIEPDPHHESGLWDTTPRDVGHWNQRRPEAEVRWLILQLARSKEPVVGVIEPAATAAPEQRPFPLHFNLHLH